MNDIVHKAIKLANAASVASFKAGYEEGYAKGYQEALAKAEQIVEEHFAKYNRPEPPRES